MYNTTLQLATRAKEASRRFCYASSEQKKCVLLRIAEELELHSKEILEENQKDLEAAEKSGMHASLLDRLSLQERIPSLIHDVHQVALLPDPVGEVLENKTLPNGLRLTKKRVPIGVIGVIYESRPNVTVDVASLCIKTGNCAILRGGSETLKTNIVLEKAIQKALAASKFPQETIQLIQNPERSQVKELLKLDAHIDMIIPRGGAGLHRFCLENSTIPVITGGIGICHLFVDESAHLQKAVEVIFNAKTQRPSVCNALDTLLVHEKVAPLFLPLVVQKLREKKVIFHVDSKAELLLQKEIQTIPNAFEKASEASWQTEWMCLTLGIRIVNSLDDAIQHIQNYGSGHSDGILTESKKNAEEFIQRIDSASVYINASTRFTDGAQYGLGAEVAISTQKLHARGPMGLKELTTYKWIGEGDYHIRS